MLSSGALSVGNWANQPPKNKTLKEPTSGWLFYYEKEGGMESLKYHRILLKLSGTLEEIRLGIDPRRAWISRRVKEVREMVWKCHRIVPGNLWRGKIGLSRQDRATRITCMLLRDERSA
jgi:hypothetical protein